MSRAFDKMLPSEVVAEISSLCGELQSKLARIQALSDGLYQRVRRAPADDNTAIYMRYASSWTRFASIASQGVRRASAGNKVLRGIAPTAAESIGKKVIRKVPADTTPVESLLDMYSEDSTLTEEQIQRVARPDAE